MGKRQQRRALDRTVEKQGRAKKSVSKPGSSLMAKVSNVIALPGLHFEKLRVVRAWFNSRNPQRTVKRHEKAGREVFEVPSERFADVLYSAFVDQDGCWLCTCADFRAFGRPCKHIIEVLFRFFPSIAPAPPTEEELAPFEIEQYKNARRFPKETPAREEGLPAESTRYDHALEEADPRAEELLFDLAALINSRWPGVAAPNRHTLPPGDKVFVRVMRVQHRKSIRRFKAIGEQLEREEKIAFYPCRASQVKYDGSEAMLTNLQRAFNFTAGVSVFDIDGARYDYTPNGTGCFTAPAGMHNALCGDGSGGGYFWYNKTGTIYYFYSPYDAQSIAGYAGRLYRIYARNQNNMIQLNYFWAGGDSSTSQNLTQIIAQHTDGQQLTMAFGMVNGRPLLSSITRPDGVQITYGYNGGHDLVSVNEPGNGSASTLPRNYGYYAADKLAWASSPRWDLSGATSGAFTNFYYDGSNRVSGVLLYGIANFTPGDGTNTPLQPISTSANTIASSTFTYPSAGETSLTDVDGHATNWFYDSAARVTQTQEWTASGSNLWLLVYASWDSANNLIASIDARGNETDTAYDANGNLTAIALPQISTTNGSIRPTIVASYDQYSNMTSYCDAVFANANGLNWSSPPGQSDTRCPNTSGTTRFTYDYSDGAEPYGKLADVYTPMSYHTHVTYDTSGATGDAGLATAATSASFTENDGTNVTPSYSAQFDAHGDVLSLANGVASWTYSYDSLNRLSTATDPDGVASYRYYNADGTISKSESAYQHATNTGATYTYDTDGNEISEQHYRGGTYNSGGSPTLPGVPSTTTNFYDGADRLVEVVLPYDQAHDVYTNPWITRYIYDLSQGSTVAFRGQTISAHGNLFKMQQFLPSGSQLQSWAAGSPKIANMQASDIKGWAFDALDRSTAQYSVVNGQISTRLFGHDSNAAYGLLTSVCNAVGQCGSATYDAAADVSSVSYNDGSTPNETYTYDPALRAITATWSNVGTQTVAYDLDGRLSASQDPSGAGLSSPATVSYHYYPNGARSSIDVNSSGLTQAGILSYSYRGDGAMQTQAITDSANGSVGTTIQHFQFTNAGRFSQQTESGPGANSATISATYQNGQLSGKTLPGGTFSTLEYDPEGMILGYAATVAGGGPQYLSFTYTTRGELALGGAANNSFANGVALANGTGSESWDDLMGVPLGTGGYTFDQAGRLTRDPSGTTRTFDANDHLTSESYVGTSDALLTYTWGPNGHPAAMGSAFGSSMPSLSQVQSDTLHWDGDQVLFSTNPSSQADDIKIGADAEILPNDSGYSGMTSYDRDITGNVAFCHNATGANGTAAADPYHFTNRFITRNVSPCRGAGMTAPISGMWWGNPQTLMPTQGAGTGQVIGMPSPDGIADDFNIIQGIRAYDPQLGTWETPDSYSGVIGDPMSESSYTYLNNNPANFKDATGLMTTGHTNCPAGEVVVDSHGTCGYSSPGIFYNYAIALPRPGGTGGRRGGDGDPAGCRGGCHGSKKEPAKPTCSIIVGGEMVPPGCALPPNPCHLDKAGPAAFKSVVNPGWAFGLGAGYLAAKAFGYAITAKEAFSFTPFGAGAAVGTAMYSGIDAAFKGCK